MIKRIGYILMVVPVAFIVTHFLGLFLSIAQFDINKHYPPIKDVWANPTLVIYGAAGYGMISIFFLCIGGIMVAFADKGVKSTELKIRFTRYVGYAFVSCGILRMMEFVAIWSNMAVMTIIISNVTGIMAGIAVFMLPSVLEEAKEQRKMEEIEKKLHDVRNIVHKDMLLKEIGNETDSNG